MLEEIKNPVTGQNTGFFKHKTKVPRDPAVNQNILAIQINMDIAIPESPGFGDSLALARDLYECLSAIDRRVLIQLKSLLPDS